MKLSAPLWDNVDDDDLEDVDANGALQGGSNTESLVLLQILGNELLVAWDDDIDWNTEEDDDDAACDRTLDSNTDISMDSWQSISVVTSALKYKLCNVFTIKIGLMVTI